MYRVSRKETKPLLEEIGGREATEDENNEELEGRRKEPSQF
jgi:hypothetical protein